MIHRFVRRVFTPPMMVLAALFLFCGGMNLGSPPALMAAIGRLLAPRELEAGIAKPPPYPAMGFFLFSVLLLLPVNLF